MTIYEYVQDAQSGNSDSELHIITQFELSLNKFARQLNYPEAKTDMTIFLINLIRNIDLSIFNSKCEGKLVNYIYFSIKNKKIDLYRSRLHNIQETSLNLNIHNPTDSKIHIDDSLIIEDFFKVLTPKQKTIMKLKFVYGFKESEIADKLNISRQAVYKTKIKSLSLIRSNLLFI